MAFIYDSTVKLNRKGKTQMSASYKLFEEQCDAEDYLCKEQAYQLYKQNNKANFNYKDYQEYVGKENSFSLGKFTKLDQGYMNHMRQNGEKQKTKEKDKMEHIFTQINKNKEMEEEKERIKKREERHKKEEEERRKKEQTEWKNIFEKARKKWKRPSANRNCSSHYDVLNVQSTDNLSTIKKAYKILAIKHHPDKNIGDESAVQRFQQISNAWDCIQMYHPN